jgi:uncharacterized membrane protein
MVKATAVTMVAGLAGVLVGGVSYAQPPRYRIVQQFDQSVPDGYMPVLQVLSDSGKAVGYVNAGGLGPDGDRAYVWDASGKTALPGTSEAPSARANDINLRGQIAGKITGWDGANGGGTELPIKAVIWDNGHLIELPPPVNYDIASAIAINDNSDVLGLIQQSETGTSSSHVAFWHDGIVEAIGSPTLSLVTLNNRRQIVGCDIPSGGTDRDPVVWENGQLRWLPPVKTGAHGCANDINEVGAIVGNSGNRPVLWQNGFAYSLNPPNLTGAATHINDRGEIIGVVGPYAFYRPASGGGVWDIWSLIDAQPGQPDYRKINAGLLLDINNSGQILARFSTIEDGQVAFHYLLLAPQAPVGDGKPPTVSITTPTTDSYLSDRVTFEATASDNVGVAAVQFFVDGKPVGPELTAPPYRTEYDLVNYPSGKVVTFYAEARDTSGNVTATNVKTMTVSNSCATATSSTPAGAWLANMTGTVTVTWTSSPMTSGLTNSGFGIGRSRMIDAYAAAATVFFAPNGEIQARNGDTFVPSGVRYSNAFYRFRMVIDLATRRYSVYFRLLNEPEQLLAEAYALHGTDTTLDNWVGSVRYDSPSPSLRVCNVREKSGS